MKKGYQETNQCCINSTSSEMHNTPNIHIFYDAIQTDSEAYLHILKQISELEDTLHGEGYWSMNTIQQTLNNDYTHLICLLDKTNVIAYCLYTAIFENAEIYRIGTIPLCHKQGYASQLLVALFDDLTQHNCERLILEVRADNIPAINLYNKHEFQHIHIRKNYYQNKNSAIDAIIMQKQL